MKSGRQKKLETEEGILAQACQRSRTWKGLDRKEDSCHGAKRPMSQKQQQNLDSDIPDPKNHLGDQRKRRINGLGLGLRLGGVGGDHGENKDGKI